MRSMMLDPHDPQWLEALADLPHDVYHLPGYAELDAERVGGIAKAVWVSDDDGRALFVPLVLRKLPDRIASAVAPAMDGSSPYGYPGPVSTPGADEAFGIAAIGDAMELMAHEGICSAFLRMHPLLEVPPGIEKVGELVDHGETVWVDLARSDDDHWAQLHRSTRQRLRRTIREGYVGRNDPEWAHLGDFRRLYTDTMARVGAADQYFFDVGYFAALRDRLKDSVHLLVIEDGGGVAAAGIFFEHAGIAQYHLSADVRAGGPTSPIRLLLEHARLFFRDRGNRVLHLGGGVGNRRDSLFDFKASLSPDRARFRTLRLITDPGTYRSAVAAWAAAHGDDSAPEPGFFPAYRQP